MNFKSTREVAKILGINPKTLQAAIWDGRVNAPQKAPSGGYLWTERDIDSASWSIRRKPYTPESEMHNG